MSPDAVTITHADTELHEAFLHFVPRVFPSIDFRAWHARGGWDDRYKVFALMEGGELIASVSRLQMDVVLNGQRVRGFQLGAVGTLVPHRGRGLQRAIMERVFSQTAADDLVFLFANDSVLDFYPRFGFERLREHLFRAELHAVPAGERLRVLDPGSVDDRALLARVTHGAEPVTNAFGARDYGSTLLWYACNFYPRALRYAPELDAIVVVYQEGALLRILDVQAPRPIDLAALVPRLIKAPIEILELCFSPERYAPEASAAVEYTESALFVHGPHRLPQAPFKYPLLAQT